MNKTAIIIFLFAFINLAFAQTDTLWTPVDIPMRDGESLAADFYAIDSTVTKPVILIQTPYNKMTYRAASFYWDTADTNQLWDLVHYHFVILDWRGFYASSGAESLGYDRGQDGYDAVEWIAGQSWCNGRIGTYGGSALGDIQFKTAKHHPPHLVCSAPYIKDFRTEYDDYYCGGVLRRQHLGSLEHLGFLTADVITAQPVENFVWDYILTNSDFAESLAVPMLLVSGWFDHYPDDIIRAFYDLKTRSAPAVRSLHKLMMGPWTHSGVGVIAQGDLTYPGAVGFDDSLCIPFFKTYLREVDCDYDTFPEFLYFQMGDEEWRSTEDWYSLADSFDTLYLNSPGALGSNFPPAGDLSDSLVYDPRNPSPSVGGASFDPTNPDLITGPADISDTVESRGDVLIYTTPPLSYPLEIRGAVSVELYASSDRLDTDFAIRLCDVYPDGRSIILTDGIRRGRFREGTRSEVLMEPDSVYLIPVELTYLAMTFPAGHRLRIDVTSSCYPRYDINPNSGGELYEPGDTLVATNRIYRSAGFPSRVIIPGTASLEISENRNRPTDFAISAYPNPFNLAVTINIGSRRGLINQIPTVEIFDLNGRCVSVIARPEAAAISSNKGDCFVGQSPSRNDGQSQFIWTPNESLGSGVYLVRATVGEQTTTSRIVYLK